MRHLKRQVRSLIAQSMFLLPALGVSFGIVAALAAIAFQIQFSSAQGIGDQAYVSLGRHNDLGQFDAVSLHDVLQIEQIAPELRWFHVETLHDLKIRDRSNNTRTLHVREVSNEYFQRLGVTAAEGTLTPPGDRSPAVVLSHALRQALGTADESPGSVLLVSRTSIAVPVAGVASPEFTGLFEGPVDAWLFNAPPALRQYAEPLPTNDRMMQRWPGKRVFGVRTDSISIHALQSLLDSYRFDDSPLAVEDPRSGYLMNIKLPGSARDRLKVVDGIEIYPRARAEVIRKLTWLSWIIVMLFALAYISLFDSLTAHHSARRSEWSVRVAVGARPSDIFAEALPLNAVSIAVIAGIAWFVSGYFREMLMRFEPFSSYIASEAVRGRGLGLTVSLVLLVFIFSLATANVSRITSRRAFAVPSSGLRNRRVLRASRWALLFVATTGLFFVFCLGWRFHQDSRIGLNFTNADALIVSFAPADWTPLQPLPEQPDFRGALMRIPDVRSAARTTATPLSGRPWAEYRRLTATGNPDWARLPLYVNAISADYFSTLGIRFLAGRTFEWGSTGEIVISRSAAQRLAGDVEQSPGMVIATRPGSKAGSSVHGEPSTAGPIRTVVGVVEDIPYVHYGREPDYVIYERASPGFGEETWIIDHTGDAVDVIGSLRKSEALAGWHIEAGDTPRTRQQQQFAAERSVEILLAAAAVFALLLALVGIGGSLARSLRQDIHAVGVHVAFGATPWQLLHRRFSETFSDFNSAFAVLTALVLAGKWLAPAHSTLFALWLLMPASVCILALCATTDLLLIRRLTQRNSISMLAKS